MVGVGEADEDAFVMTHRGPVEDGMIVLCEVLGTDTRTSWGSEIVEGIEVGSGGMSTWNGRTSSE